MLVINDTMIVLDLNKQIIFLLLSSNKLLIIKKQKTHFIAPGKAMYGKYCVKMSLFKLQVGNEVVTR